LRRRRWEEVEEEEGVAEVQPLLRNGA